MPGDWYDGFTKHPDNPPARVAITVGPFAQNGGSGSSGWESRVGSREKSARVVEVQPVGQIEHGDGKPNGRMALVDGGVTEKTAAPMADAMTGPGQVNTSSVIAGTPPMDPGVTTAPAESAPKPPVKSTPASASVVARLMARRKIKEPEKPVNEKTEPVDDESVGGMVAETSQTVTAPGLQPQKTAAVLPRVTMADVLRAIGAPDQFTAPGSLVWDGVLEKKASVDAADPVESAQILSRDDAHPVAISWLLGAMYGDAWTGWEPETIEQTIEQDTGIKISTVIQSKIAALKVVLNVPSRVSDEWHIFEKVCVAFDGNPPRMNIVEDLSPETMTFGITCIQQVAGLAWSPSQELQTYVAARLHDAGFVVPPPPMAWSNDELKKMGSDTTGLASKVIRRYAQVLAGGDGAAAHGEDEQVNIQVDRILRCNTYALDKADDLVRQLS